MRTTLLLTLAAALAVGGAGPARAAAGASQRVELTVQKVYAAKDGEFAQRAYGVVWQGQEVVVIDRLLQTNYHTDDTITVDVTRHPFPQGKEPYGLLHFLLVRPKGTKGGVAGGGSGGAMPPDPEPRNAGGHFDAVVRKVFSAQDGGDIFQAYVVEWKGEEVIVSNTLANSHYGVGDTFKAMVFKHRFPLGEEIRGLLNFETVSPHISARMKQRE